MREMSLPEHWEILPFTDCLKTDARLAREKADKVLEDVLTQLGLNEKH